MITNCTIIANDEMGSDVTWNGQGLPEGNYWNPFVETAEIHEICRPG
jgi:hypothetical protein